MKTPNLPGSRLGEGAVRTAHLTTAVPTSRTTHVSRVRTHARVAHVHIEGVVCGPSHGGSPHLLGAHAHHGVEIVHAPVITRLSRGAVRRRVWVAVCGGVAGVAGGSGGGGSLGARDPRAHAGAGAADAAGDDVDGGDGSRAPN